ncbi:MAG: BatA domain-containing protein [Candidatus Marinimicrobia bacterium]|nr:BatA domain-containing protein [Candidatus Neomarinimicrobiota bacterium]
MSFFSKIFLYFLPLASIPLIIHLLSKSRIRTVEFSSLKFLIKLKNDAIRKLKLRQLILLIIRTLLVLFLVLFFARPYLIDGNQEIYPVRGDLFFLLVDNSHSMNERVQDNTLLNKKITEIRELAQFFEFPIELKIIYASEPKNIIEMGKIDDREAFQKILNAAPATFAEGDLVESINSLKKYGMDNKIINAKLWVVSDFQKTDGLDRCLEELGQAENIQPVFFPVSHSGFNHAISHVTFPRQILEVNKNIRIQSKLEYWQEFHETKLSLFIEGQRVAQDISKNTGATFDFEFLPLKSGPLTGYLSLPDDNLPEDNRYYFSLNIPEKLDLLLVSRQVQSSYLEKALTAGKKSLLQVTSISPEILAMENLEDYDVLIFHNISELPELYVARFKDFLAGGKGIVVLPGMNGSISEYNNFWHKQMGLPIWKRNLVGDGESYLRLKNINTSHPIFSQIWQNKESFKATAQFFAIPEFERYGTVLIDYNNGSPFLTETKERKLMLIAAFITASESNLQLTGFFPVLMQQTVLYLANFSQSLANYTIGDTLRYSCSDMDQMAKFRMKTPDNRSFLLDFDKTSQNLIFKDTNLPGFYKLYLEDKLVQNYAVNISSHETLGEFISGPELDQKKLSVYSEGPLTNGPKTNREIGSLVLGLIFLLLLAETYLARINRN